MAGIEELVSKVYKEFKRMRSDFEHMLSVQEKKKHGQHKYTCECVDLKSKGYSIVGYYPLILLGKPVPYEGVELVPLMKEGAESLSFFERETVRLNLAYVPEGYKPFELLVDKPKKKHTREFFDEERKLEGFFKKHFALQIEFKDESITLFRDLPSRMLHRNEMIALEVERFKADIKAAKNYLDRDAHDKLRDRMMERISKRDAAYDGRMKKQWYGLIAKARQKKKESIIEDLERIFSRHRLSYSSAFSYGNFVFADGVYYPKLCSKLKKYLRNTFFIGKPALVKGSFDDFADYSWLDKYNGGYCFKSLDEVFLKDINSLGENDRLLCKARAENSTVDFVCTFRKDEKCIDVCTEVKPEYNLRYLFHDDEGAFTTLGESIHDIMYVKKNMSVSSTESRVTYYRTFRAKTDAALREKISAFLSDVVKAIPEVDSMVKEDRVQLEARAKVIWHKYLKSKKK